LLFFYWKFLDGKDAKGVLIVKPEEFFQGIPID
jgi:hypothetical protein